MENNNNNLHPHHNISGMFEIINNLAKFGTGTAIGLALRATARVIKPTQRSGIPFNVLVITDGMNNIYPNPKGEAEKLKQSGANIITLGIGKGINLYVHVTGKGIISE